MRRNRFMQKKHTNEEMTLQITSMADIFTILLVFLLKSFSTGLSTITPSNDITLPDAKGGDEVADVLKVEISPNVILVDDKPVVKLRGFRFEPTDVEANKTSRSLNSKLIEERKKREMAEVGITQDKGQKTPNARKLMILADEKAPYATVKSVLTSSGNAGFVDFKLVVIGDE